MQYFTGQTCLNFLSFVTEQVLYSRIAEAFLWIAVVMLSGTAVSFFLLIILPRVVEDYVKIYNWYINSELFIIFEEKVDLKFIFKLIVLPFHLVASMFFSVMNLMIKTSYHLAAKLNLLRCVNCHATVEWSESTVNCHICGEKVMGNITKSCPGCNFKPNAIRCPYCGYIVFVELTGKNPSERARSISDKQSKHPNPQ